ncbi:hypothetical protein N8742_05055 [Emcibacteraceae bacterium]|jgi:hypothetical protein|nr:hypothetical protein [Kordiimonadaceae bacterium]MDA7569061.1 hypothetical protein [Emcibacteraceae bacterium]MDA9180333.1 hypothetical protein [Emcibacteraceae bacterium]MDA9553843.1 hypothetical protein [Emcibacteraceae bacterium]
MSKDDFESISNKKLNKLIKETRETITELEDELEKRNLEKRHAEIDHLEEHMEEVEHNFSTFMTFLKTVLKEKK